MMRYAAPALLLSVVALGVACGNATDPLEPSKDAGADVTLDVRRHDASDAADTASSYQPLGVRCVRDAAAVPPPPFVAPTIDAGNSPLDGGDASTEGGAVTAQLPQLPQVVTKDGVVAAAPVIIPITFDGDDQRDAVEDFVASLGCTSYWRAFMGDYGVGDAITGTPIHVAEAPPATISDASIQKWLFSKIKTDSRFPNPDARHNILYAIFYPGGTTVTASFGQSCSSFGAYHSAMPYDPAWAPYAVMPRCQSDLAWLTTVASHEIYEFASDPAAGGYQQVADQDVAWSTLFGSEIGDMCEHTSTAQFQAPDYPFALQRGWSNRAAFLGNDPCVPSDGALWFAAAPVVTDVVKVNYGATVSARGVKLAVGAQTTIDVAMLSNGITSGWHVKAEDLSPYLGRGSALSMSLDKAIGHEGETLKLTIRRTGTNAVYAANPFWLRSTAPGQDHVWFGIVGD